MINLKEHIIKETKVLCPQCNIIRDGEIIAEDNHINLVIKCPTHGKQVELLFDNQDFYFELKNIIKSNKKDLVLNINNQLITVNPIQHKITTIHINFTEKCNLKCKDCFAICDPENNSQIDEISIVEIMKQLEPFRLMKHKPMIVIIGGEPTLRKDLPDLIKILHEDDYVVRLSTNGLLLTDLKFMQKLIDCGLDWLLLQFDGFNKDTSIKFRGLDLIDKKQQVLENAEKLNLQTHLIMMVSKGDNDNELLQALNFAFDRPQIFALNYYPVSQTGRYADRSTSALDCIKKLEEQSHGTISKADFIESKKFWNFLYKIFKKPIFRQQMCTFPMFFFRKAGNIYSVHNLFKISNIFKHPIFAIRYGFKLFSLFKWASNPSKDFVYLNIEKFYNSNALDVEEAYDCHNVFLTKKGFIPFCIFNSLYRMNNCF